MRVSALRDKLLERGMDFGERIGVEVPLSCSGSADEYHFIRDAVGITDFSFQRKLRVPGQTGIDWMDSLFAGNVARVRFGRVLHTFLADDYGHLVADCYIANNDEEYLVLCENIVDDAAFDAIIEGSGATDAGVEDISDTYALIGVDGYKAWAVVKELFGPDVLGLPYLSVEVYPFQSSEVYLIRAGKTSEFGYCLLVPIAGANDLLEAVLTIAEQCGGGLCGVSIHNDLRLEGRFFNIFAEGLTVGDPLSLGLQWMIDFGKDEFRGSEAIFSRRAAGLSRKVVGFSAESDCSGFVRGASIFDGAEEVARLETECFSYTLDRWIGLALLPVDLSYSGLTFRLGGENGHEIRTISMPPIMPKSLTVKLDEL